MKQLITANAGNQTAANATPQTNKIAKWLQDDTVLNLGFEQSIKKDFWHFLFPGQLFL